MYYISKHSVVNDITGKLEDLSDFNKYQFIIIRRLETSIPKKRIWYAVYVQSLRTRIRKSVWMVKRKSRPVLFRGGKFIIKKSGNYCP